MNAKEIKDDDMCRVFKPKCNLDLSNACRFVMYVL